MDRRRFTFWLGFGLFSLSEKLHVAGFDALAAATMRSSTAAKAAKRTGAEHWTVAGNKEWRWFERENLVKGDWVVTGRTTPINKLTGKRKAENVAYIDDSLVPADLRANDAKKLDLVDHEAIAAKDAADEKVKLADHQVAAQDAKLEHDDHHSTDGEPKVDLDPQLPNSKRRARHGRPPSKWLRSLNASEISVWLKTVELPDAGVSGMTVWAHLTRDHGFAGDRIEGLTETEQDKLHAAAHYGY